MRPSGTERSRSADTPPSKRSSSTRNRPPRSVMRTITRGAPGCSVHSYHSSPSWMMGTSGTSLTSHSLKKSHCTHIHTSAYANQDRYKCLTSCQVKKTTKKAGHMSAALIAGLVIAAVVIAFVYKSIHFIGAAQVGL